MSGAMKIKRARKIAMKFSIVLYGFYILMRFTSWRHAPFREHLKGQDFSMVIRTADGKRARRYSLSGGAIASRRGADAAADFALIWKDAGTGFRSMMKMKPGALMLAIADGSLKLEGDAGRVTAFLSVYKQLLACYK
jgi:hypothetical protein